MSLNSCMFCDIWLCWCVYTLSALIVFIISRLKNFSDAWHNNSTTVSLLSVHEEKLLWISGIQNWNWNWNTSVFFFFEYELMQQTGCRIAMLIWIYIKDLQLKGFSECITLVEFLFISASCEVWSVQFRVTVTNWKGADSSVLNFAQPWLYDSQ